MIITRYDVVMKGSGLAMLFDTRSTQAAEASLDALWLQTKVIANNMANVETPNFKSSSVKFEEVLDRAAKLDRSAQENREGRVLGGALHGGGARYRTTVTRDDTSQVRVDGNNVVLEREQTELWKTYAQYSYLLDSVSGHYRNIGTAISNMKR